MSRSLDKADVLKQKAGSLVASTTIESDSNDSVHAVFEKLVANKIQSVPIYNAKKQKYVGLIDLSDIVFFLLDNLKEQEIRDCTVPANLLKTNCMELKNKSKKNPFKPIQKDASLEAILDILEASLHRVPVINEIGELVGMLSQSSIVKFIYNYIQLFDIRHTVGEIKLGYKDSVYTVTEDTLAKEAFEKIRDCGVTGVAVVNNEGVLVGCLSLSDLRILGTDFSQMRRVYLTVSEYLANKESDKKPEILHVTASTTVTEVADMFFKFGVHRLFVVDENKKPIGVISLSDYLKVFRGAALAATK